MLAINNSFPLELGWTKIIETNNEDIHSYGFIRFTYPVPSPDCWLLYLNNKKLNKLKCVNSLKNLFYDKFKDIIRSHEVDCVIATRAQLDEFRSEAFEVLQEEIIVSKIENDASSLILVDLANTKAELIEAIALVGIFCFNPKDAKYVRFWTNVISAKMESLSE
jgi:hypothetical protein